MQLVLFAPMVGVPLVRRSRARAVSAMLPVMHNPFDSVRVDRLLCVGVFAFAIGDAAAAVCGCLPPSTAAHQALTSLASCVRQIAKMYNASDSGMTTPIALFDMLHEDFLGSNRANTLEGFTQLGRAMYYSGAFPCFLLSSCAHPLCRLQPCPR